MLLYYSNESVKKLSEVKNCIVPKVYDLLIADCRDYCRWVDIQKCDSQSTTSNVISSHWNFLNLALQTYTDILIVDIIMSTLYSDILTTSSQTLLISEWFKKVLYTLSFIKSTAIPLSVWLASVFWTPLLNVFLEKIIPCAKTSIRNLILDFIRNNFMDIVSNMIGMIITYCGFTSSDIFRVNKKGIVNEFLHSIVKISKELEILDKENVQLSAKQSLNVNSLQQLNKYICVTFSKILSDISQKMDMNRLITSKDTMKFLSILLQELSVPFVSSVSAYQYDISNRKKALTICLTEENKYPRCDRN